MMRLFQCTRCLTAILFFCSLLQPILTLPRSVWLSYQSQKPKESILHERVDDLPTPLDDGWSMHINNIGCFTPFRVAVQELASFYSGVLAGTIMARTNRQPRASRLHYTYGLLSLVLESTEPIEWEWVMEFTEQIVSRSILGAQIPKSESRNRYKSFMED